MAPDASRMSDGMPIRDAVATRSVLAVSGSLLIRTGDTATELIAAHTMLPDGSIALAVDAMTPAGGQLVAARSRPGGLRLEVTSVVPVPVRCRVRARVTVTGTVRALDPATLDDCDAGTIDALLDLPPVALWAVEPVAVRLERHSTSDDVAVDAYRAARPDPLAAIEATYLHQLVRHGLDGLTLPARLASARGRLAPVAIDADGLTLRSETRQGHHDARLPFASRVTAEAELARELALLTPAITAPDRSRPNPG
ncbi:hypothetical protein DFJ67_5588 [Asanoa ferruginea]|uniref:DUF2470 domain-containing protein n=1 Tax=Asanoa ferruginea TaxID=53367 RepID=A0A3D9ZRN4_9ACTN|nr:DUF2470 domain-containing protein [Asanoa ferruginea]REF99549.1 hypothetical protein DFJ67_5588 [Asanoa ferruginea]GIF52254.1 prephenate dehydratase [Asanoa ferruginea]